MLANNLSTSWLYLNKPIEIDEIIKLANQLVQQRTHDRNEKDNDKDYYFWNQKIGLLFEA